MKNNTVFKKDISRMLLAGILFLLAAGITGGAFLLRGAALEDSLVGDRVIGTLFILENDGRPMGTYALFFYSRTRRGALFDIPQDTGLILRSLNRVGRIDDVYDPLAPERYRREVEGLLGITLPYLVVINMQNLRALVDLIEGVEVNIPEAAGDFEQSPPVLLPAGRVTLDGDKAQVYLTYLAPGDTSEHIVSKREGFFLSLIKKIGEMQMTLSKSGVKNYFHACLQTTMNTRTIDRLFGMLSTVNMDRLTAQSVSGIYREVSGERLLIPHYDGSLVKDIVSKTLAGLSRASDADDSRIRTVEVLNGTSTAGLAARTAELLRGFGYDVINVGNADARYDQTLIVDRSEADGQAAALADIIRCKNIRVESPANKIDEGVGINEQDTDYTADFILILGGDFNGRYVTQ